MPNSKKLGLYRTTTYLRAFLMFGVDMLGYGLLLPWTIQRYWYGKKYNPQKVKKIAVFRLDGIGDLVLSIPCIQTLRSAFTDAELTLFANKWSSGLPEMIPEIDRVVYLDAPFFRAIKKPSDLGDILKERRQLKRHGKSPRYDIALDLRGDFLSILEALWLNPKLIMARSSRAGGFFLTNRIVQSEEGCISEIDLNQRFIRKICKPSSTGRSGPWLKLNAKNYFHPFSEALGDDYICLAVAAPYATRCYPQNRWLQLIKLIRTKYSKPIAILGSPDEESYCRDIAENAEKGIYSLAGKLTLAESIKCIANCRLFIGNDGGLIHIASALKKPVVQLFGPASSKCFGHFGENEHVLQIKCPFNPCPEPHCKTPKNWCMDRIAPERIFHISRRYFQDP